MIEQQTRLNGVTYSAGFGERGAQSPYRYTLRREWVSGLIVYRHDEPCPCHICAAGERLTQHALFIMLNPSTADAMKDDPTVAKCMRFARRWGYGAVEVRNIFALRSTDPRALRVSSDPTGGMDNDVAIIDAANNPRTGIIVAAWGNHGTLLDRSTEVRAFLKATGRPVHAFAISKTGEPCHPLYQREHGVTPETLVRFI